MNGTLTTQTPASDAQVTRLIRALAERIEDPAKALEAIKWVNEHRMTSSLASAKITEYEAKPKFREAFTHARTSTSTDVEVGLYNVDGKAYKVKRAVYGSGFLYACPWDEEAQRFGGKETGAIRKIRASHRMTREEAGKYGLAMSACAHCGRALTDEDSIALGLGPICAGKY